MVSGIDHVTIVVTDLDEARRFFSLLDMQETVAVVASGDTMARYMGIPGWEADHVTLTMPAAPGHQEIQLLRFHHPALEPNDVPARLDRLGFNHLCLAVDNLDATLRMMEANGFPARNEVLDYHHRRLVFLDGPGGVVVELAEHDHPVPAG